jgi:two-component system, OmpR family, sensor kinase
MSLRLRLTLIFTALLSGVVLLLSIVVYSMVSAVMVNQVDDVLQENADLIIDVLHSDVLGGIEVDDEELNVPNMMYYQIWSDEEGMIYSSENIEELATLMDSVAINQDQTVFRNVEILGIPYRVLTVPLMTAETKVGWLQVGLTMADVQHTQHLLLIVFGISAVFSIIVVGVLGWLVTGQALEPLETMSRITDRITSTDDLSQRIPVSSTQHDEIQKLVLTFNKTLVRLERLFNSQQRFLADVSHELRTPLTVIKGNVGLMRMMNAYDEESLRSIESEVDRLTRLVKDLLLMTQAETGRMPLMMEPVELDDLLFEVFEQMKVLSAGVHDIQISNMEPAVVTGDRDRLKQVLLNLGCNAIKFSPKNGHIDLSLYVKKKWVVITVSDEGPGIPPKERNYLFQRFYRGDKSRTRKADESGFGLGLPIAYWIVRSHGGYIDVVSEVNKGTTFSVRLPVSQSEIPTKPMRQMKERGKGEG